MKVEVNEDVVFKDTFSVENIVHNQQGTIVIVMAKNGEEQFCGLAIQLSEKDKHMARYQTSWRKKDFSLFNGAITISN